MASVKPVAGDDYLSFFENETIQGNLLTNDTAGGNGNKFLRFFDGENVLAKKAGQITDIVGEHGTFHVKADGSFTYTLNDSAKAGFTEGETLQENITYKISDGTGNTDVAIFKLDIKGVNNYPIAVDDSFTFSESQTISGNVLDNDIPGDNGKLFLRSAEGTTIGAKQGLDQVTDVKGGYGTFHFKPTGAFTYDLYDTVKAEMEAGDTRTEKIEYYKISDGSSHTDVGIVTLTIYGESGGDFLV